jgi:hypothetical protein
MSATLHYGKTLSVCGAETQNLTEDIYVITCKRCALIAGNLMLGVQSDIQAAHERIEKMAESR